MLKKTLPVIIIVSMAFILNCGSKLDSGAVSPMSMINFDSGLSSMIYSVYPDINSTGISTSSQIKVYFALDMNPASFFSGSTFIVTDDNKNVITGTVVYDSSTRIATFTLTPAGSQFGNSKKYTVTMTTGITDSTGNPLPSDQKFEFTTVDVNTVPAPVFSLMEGPYTGTQGVILSCFDNTPTIHYTTDGSTPSKTNGAVYVYGTTIPISATMTLRAMGEKAGMNDSSVTSAEYTITPMVDAPLFNLAGGTYNNDIDIDITCATTGAVIYFTTDGSIPTAASATYDGTPIAIGGEGTSMTVRAIAVKPGMANSTIASAAYTISYFQAVDPTFNPPAGPLTSPQNVTIDTTSSGATIRYTTDGSDPTSSLTYTDALPPVTISVNDTMTIRAYVVSATELIPSNESTVTYIMAPTIASISPNSGEINGIANATITGTNFKTGATVLLRLGGEPDVNATVVTLTGTSITCTIDLTGVTNGTWNVVVTNTDTGVATLANGFRTYTLPSTGLISWWKMDGDFNDALSTNNPTLINGTFNFSDDRFTPPNPGSTAVNNTGIYYVEATTNGFPTGNAARTIMGWVKLDAIHIMDNFLFGYGDSSFQYKLVVSGTSNCLVLNTGSEMVEGITALKPNHWYHVAAVYNGTVVTLYVNGFPDGSGTAAVNTPAASTMYFYKYGMPTPWLEGGLDDIRVYDHALAIGEIQTIVNEKGYLVAPDVSASKGALPDRVVISWGSLPDATGYDVFRSTTLTGTYTKINVSPIPSTTFDDTSVVVDDMYYYKVQASNASMTSDLSKAQLGFAGAATTFAETFETGTYDPWWTDVTALGTPYAINGIGNYTGSYGLYVGPSSCSSGCSFANEMRFTKTFGTPITYFDLSMWFCRQTMNGGEIRVYVNNTNPTDTTGMVRFFNPTQPVAGWIQRSLFYMGDPGTINSITIVFYDITNGNWYYADDIMIKYK
jgi:hypothetical protein